MTSIRAEQSAALLRMLELNKDTSKERWQDPWKVLVYDAYCRDIISPLLKVGDLRKQGITLHLLIDGEREAISDVPAIYFMQPTQANVRRLGDDCSKQLYESFYVNFTPAVPRPLLEELAATTLESDSVAQISRVMDQYLNFASLEEDFFSLQLPQSYRRLNDPASPDSLVEQTIEHIVSGLFSAVVTLGAVPILRYAASGGPAQMVAEQLGRRLHDQLKAHPQLFSEGQHSGFQRPLLILTERALDFAVMIQHAWSYCALCHDLLDLRLNRVTIYESASEGAPKTKPKTYDLHAADPFWTKHMGAAFQDVASDVDKELSEYRAAMDQINAGSKLESGGDSQAVLADTTRQLASTISQLPELQEKKRLIDAHMNIATELLGLIRSRSIDSYYAVEESLMEGRSLSSEDKGTLQTLIKEGGTPEDRLRLLLLMHLHPNLPAGEVLQHEQAMKEAGADMRAHTALKRLMSESLASLQSLQTSAASRQGASAASGASTGGKVFSNVMRLADQAGVGSLAGRVGSALAAGVRQLLPSKRETPVTRVVQSLMDNKGGSGSPEESYSYLDPKLGPTADSSGSGGGTGRSRNPFGQAIVFVVGPGNYLEYQSLRQQAQAAQPGAPGLGGRKVTYGCSEVLTSSEFVAQLNAIGGVQ